MSLILLLAAAGAVPEMVNQPVKDKPVAEIAAGETYLMVRASGANGGFATPLAFFREADAAELADYKARRSEALAKAHAKWVRKLASWDREYADWKGLPAGTRGTEPEKPVEPTESNFNFDSIEQEQLIIVGPFNRFAKDKVNNVSVYVSRVRPGRYHFYGPIQLTPQGAAFGTCACMGSVAFEVAPGKVTDAGTMRLNLMEAMVAAKEGKGPKPKDEFDLPDGVTQVGWTAAGESTPIDPRLANISIVRASLHASGPFPNWYKAQVDRLTAIPGVLEYDRGRIIDPSKTAAGSGR